MCCGDDLVQVKHKLLTKADECVSACVRACEKRERERCCACMRYLCFLLKDSVAASSSLWVYFKTLA